MYSVSYIKGNGYFCGCCREQEKRSERFQSLGDAVMFAARINILAANMDRLQDLDDWRAGLCFVPEGYPCGATDGDYQLIQIHGPGPRGGRKHLLNDPDVKAMVARAEAELEEELQLAEAKIENARREKRRRHYEALKKEFEGKES